MLLAEEVAHEGIVIEVQLFAILAILDIILVDVLSIIPTDSFPLCVSLLKGRKEGFLKLLLIKKRSRPPYIISQVLVNRIEVGCVLGLMLELLVDGEIIKFIHILQEPQIIVQTLGLGIVHHLADVQEL
jgi:hypothetical protein